MDSFEKDLAEGRASIDDEGRLYTTTTWRPVALEPFLDGDAVVEPPLYLPRSDGRGIIYPGRAHSFWGPSESLKSAAALAVCASAVAVGRTAAYIDFEADPVSFVDRVRTFGIEDAVRAGSLVYVRPDEPLSGKRAEADFIAMGRDLNPAVVVLDGVTEAFAIHGWNPRDETDVARYQRLLVKGFSETAAKVEIDHAPHGGGHQIGSQHKRAGIDGASFRFKVGRSAGVGGDSFAEVFLAKDRHGYVRAFAPHLVGFFHLDTSSGRDGPVTTLQAPSVASMFVPPDSVVDDAVEAFIRSNPGVNRSAIATGTGKGNSTVVESLKRLEASGRVRRTDGPRNSKLYWVNS